MLALIRRNTNVGNEGLLFTKVERVNLEDVMKISMKGSQMAKNRSKV